MNLRRPPPQSRLPGKEKGKGKKGKNRASRKLRVSASPREFLSRIRHSPFVIRNSSTLLLLIALAFWPAGCRGGPAATVPASSDDDASPAGCRWETGVDGSPMLVLSNGLIEVDFNRDDGRVVQVKDLRRSPPLLLLDATTAGRAPPYEITELDKDAHFANYYHSASVPWPTTTPVVDCADAAATLTWTPPGDYPVVAATWTLTDGAPEARVQFRASRLGTRLIQNLRYPILPQLATLSPADPGDVLLLPVEGGMQISRPLDRLGEELADGGRTLQSEHYPLGHEAMVQLEAYLHAGVGGMLLYTADPGFGNKAFEFAARAPADGKTAAAWFPAWQVLHWNPDIHAAEFAPAYPVVLRWLDAGTWDEAAEIYRAWSDKQVWAQQPVAQRAPAERQFFERLGASVFGVSAAVDQRPWVQAFRQALVDGVADAQLLFVFGWDFHPLATPADPPYYMAMQQAGRDPAYWSPLVGATQANITQAQQQGDLTALFYYDLLVDTRTPGWNGFSPPDNYWQYLVYGPYGLPGGFSYPDIVNNGTIYTLDPADPFVADFWKWRDRLVVAQSNPPIDALYFDLGFAVTFYGSYDSLAGIKVAHPDGAGTWQQQAVRDILDDARGMANPRGFRYGAENVTEPYVDLVDFWHLGESGLGPMANKIAGSNPSRFSTPAAWIMNGTAIPTPLLPYLQHHLGALRTGAKMEISAEMGEAFYWIAAAEYLWGGVVELIYYNTPMEWLPTLDAAQACDGKVERCGFQTDWGRSAIGTPRGWYTDDAVKLADPALLAFLKNAIRLRVNSAASPYLTLGRMAAPPAFDPPPAPYSFTYSYYGSLSGPDCEHSGTWDAAPVQAVAWRHPTDDKIALLASNASSLTISTSLVADLSQYGMTGGAVVEVNLADSTSQTVLPADPQRAAVVRLPATFGPHSVKMWEITPP